MVGESEVARLCLVALLAEGHVLLEDVPGVGKTMMVKALSKFVNAEFKRIQFTADLLPSDVLGISIYNPKEMEFTFRPGPIMGNLILADEINRTSPRTQSALLEAMEELSVTIDGVTLEMEKPFFVMATQNPIEYEACGFILSWNYWIPHFWIWTYRNRQEEESFTDAYEILLKRLGNVGLKRRPGQTLRSYADDVDRHFDTADMSQLTKRYEELAYSRNEDLSHWDDSKELWENLMKMTANRIKKE